MGALPGVPVLPEKDRAKRLNTRMCNTKEMPTAGKRLLTLKIS
jgi:hypothetical protein